MLAPLYYPYEYLIHRPLGALVSAAERHRIADSVENLFEFDHGSGIVAPTAWFDFGMLPSVGVYFGWDGVGANTNAVRFHVGTWGPAWINATAIDRYRYDDGAGQLQARFDFKRSEDNLFFGLGASGTDALRSRYGLQHEELTLGFSRMTTAISRVSIDVGARHVGFVDGTCCGDPSLADRIADGLMPPPGYGSAYTVAVGHAAFTLDDRPTGAFVRVHADPSFGDGSWLGYGVDAGVSIGEKRRSLALQVATDFVDPMTSNTVPFTELASMDDDLMAGFVPGWMVGRSTAAAQLAYRWPVWPYLDGQARASVGNAFGAHLDDFSLRQLRVSGDLGLTTDTGKAEAFEVLVGVGSETFAQGGAVTSVRLLVGARRGF